MLECCENDCCCDSLSEMRPVGGFAAVSEPGRDLQVAELSVGRQLWDRKCESLSEGVHSSHTSPQMCTG